MDRTTPWAVAFAFVLLVATAGAATQKAPMFASVDAGLDLAGSETRADAEVAAEVEVRTPQATADLLPRLPAGGRAPSGGGSSGPHPSPSGNGTSGNQTGSHPQPPTNETPPPQPPTNGTGGSGGNGTTGNPGNQTGNQTAPRVPQKAPILSPEEQNATGATRTTMRFEISVTNPDAKEQGVRLDVVEPAGWSVNLSERSVMLEPGETRLIQGRAVTPLSAGGRATITIYAKGVDGRDTAYVHVCARGIFIDLCQPASSSGGNGTNSTSPPSNGTTPPSNTTTPPPSNHTTTPPPSNQTTTPPSNTTAQPPSNTTSSDPTPPTNSTGPASPAPTPPPSQSPPPPPPSNQTSTAPASPPASEEDEGDGFWVDAEVGAEGEASSDGLRVEV